MNCPKCQSLSEERARLEKILSSRRRELNMASSNGSVREYHDARNAETQALLDFQIAERLLTIHLRRHYGLSV